MQKFPHEPAETAGRFIGILTIFFFQFVKGADPVGNSLTLAGIRTLDPLQFFSEYMAKDLGAEFSLVLIIVQRIIIGKGHVHIRAVADVLVVGPGTHGMQGTGMFSPVLLRFVQTHQE